MGGGPEVELIASRAAGEAAVDVPLEFHGDHGREWYDNDEYKNDYIEWRFPPRGGWVEHGSLRITFANGEVAYLDNSAIRGRIISYPEPIPDDWWETGNQSLDKAKGKPPYATWADLRTLSGALWRFCVGE